MEVPIGFLGMLWSFISFVPFFFSLLLLSLIKAAIICPVVSLLVFFGNSAVIIGLWPAHFFWTYYCVIGTKRLGLILKILILIILPVPLVLWPVFSIPGSLLVGIGYGLFAPLVATFEAAGESVSDKLYHCFADGCTGTIKEACTSVRDFTDFCFYSYFSYMDDMSEKTVMDEAPIDIRLSRLPSCLLVGLLGVPIDVLMITMLALWKSPYMLLKGWQRLFHDLIGREGPFLETVCVPFAGLALVLWPLAVVGGVIAAFTSSFFLGLYGSIITYQEDSLQMGLAYIISAVSLFDEYSNDLLYFREGSCLPRPKYRKTKVCTEHPGRGEQVEQNKAETKNVIADSNRTMLASQRSRTLKMAIRQLEPFQIWDWLFKSCELNGKLLLGEGLVSVADIEECIIEGKCKKLSIKLPAWCILQSLLQSAKSDSYGLIISEGVELTDFNWPMDKILEWFLGPLLIMKEQLKGIQLNENEESCLRKLIMIGKHERPEDWDYSGFPSDDNVRRAQLQALIRRLQGMVASMSRFPTFRRRFSNLAKSLYLEAIETGALSPAAVNSKSRGKIGKLTEDSREKQKKVTENADLPSKLEVSSELA